MENGGKNLFFPFTNTQFGPMHSIGFYMFPPNDNGEWSFQQNGFRPYFTDIWKPVTSPVVL